MRDRSTESTKNHNMKSETIDCTYIDKEDGAHSTKLTSPFKCEPGTKLGVASQQDCPR